MRNLKEVCEKSETVIVYRQKPRYTRLFSLCHNKVDEGGRYLYRPGKITGLTSNCVTHPLLLLCVVLLYYLKSDTADSAVFCFERR